MFGKYCVPGRSSANLGRLCDHLALWLTTIVCLDRRPDLWTSTFKPEKIV